MLDMNLQLFAEGDEEETTTEEENTEEKIELSKEEYQKKLDAEADRRVTKALQTAKQKWESEFGEKLEKEKQEAVRLEKLSADEKEKELREKQLKELEERENQLKYKELLSDTKDILHEEKIPVKFADVLVQESAEKTKEKIDAFKKEWQDAIEEAVNERLKGSTPKKPGEPEKNEDLSAMRQAMGLK